MTTQGSHWVTAWSGSGSVSFNVNPNDGSSHTTTLRVSGNGVDWTTNARRVGTISQGQVARLAFKLSQTGTGAVLALETTDSAYYVGVYEEAGALRLRVKQNAVYTNVGTLLATVSANVWYGLELAVDGAAGFRASVWREDTPGVRDELRYEMPAGTSWRFRVWAKSGQTYIDGTTGPSYAYVEEVPAQSASDSRIVGKHYEYDSVSAQTTKRYYVGGRLVATRTGSSVRYVHADHLGSTTTLTD